MIGLKALLDMPQGTIFQRFEPVTFGRLEILGGTMGTGDLISCPIGEPPIDCRSIDELFAMTEDMAERGASLPVVLDGYERDGAVPHGQLFAVWEDGDVDTLIAQLRKARAGSGGRARQN